MKRSPEWRAETLRGLALGIDVLRDAVDHTGVADRRSLERGTRAVFMRGVTLDNLLVRLTVLRNAATKLERELRREAHSERQAKKRRAARAS